MKTKIVYVLVSSPDDLYLEQTFVSVFTMKYHNPDAQITLLVDEATGNTLVDKRANIFQYITELKTVAIDDKYTNMQKSRILKTTVREHIDGDFLFVDSDTIICEPLDAIDDLNCEIGAVYDVHQKFENNYGKQYLSDRLIRYFDFNASLVEEYFNSGVMFVKDTPTAHQFYHKWHDNWEIGANKGLSLDQTSLAVTDYQLGRVIVPISGIYNCQIRYNINYLVDAKILHYFSSNQGDISTLFENIFYRLIKKDMTIPKEYLPLLKDPKRNFSPLISIKGGIDAELCNSAYLFCGVQLYQKARPVYKCMLVLLRIIRKLVNIRILAKS